MAKKKREKTFIQQHLAAWCWAALFGTIGVVINSIYQTILAPLQAEVAAGQLDDSMASWVLHQQTSYGDVIPNVIIAGTVIITVAFLVPTLIHAFKRAITD